ncbi:hypothetical protein [Micromonospora sp. WMMD736]|uniref:hypothetical protein n=1 Tax=Micromonospora sp. WMMD736 TaxID=3404112 RepID=UPI003B948F7F
MTTKFMSNFELAEEARKGLPELAATVARELGEGWQATHDEHTRWFDLKGPDGEWLMINIDSHAPERVDIDSRLPREIHASGADTHGLRTPEISVALRRGAVTIAKEINRRLLPDYRDILLTARKLATNALRDRAERDDVARTAAELLGVQRFGAGEPSNPLHSVYFRRHHQGRGMTSVEIRPGGYVRIETNGDIEDMRDVLAALGKVPA